MTPYATQSTDDDLGRTAAQPVKGDRLNGSDRAASRIETSELEPKDVLFDSFRTLVEVLLKSPMKDREIADALDITPAQTKVWLDRMVIEGSIKKLPQRPVHYVMDRDLLDELRNA